MNETLLDILLMLSTVVIGFYIVLLLDHNNRKPSKEDETRLQAGVYRLKDEK